VATNGAGGTPNPPAAGATSRPPVQPPAHPVWPPARPPRTAATHARGSPTLGAGAAIALLGVLPSTKSASRTGELELA
jgi:hypothetical protein